MLRSLTKSRFLHSVILPAALRLFYLRRAFHSSDYSIEATGAIIATQCVLHYSVMSASFSYLKPFLAAFDSNFGATIKLDTLAAAHSAQATKESGGGRKQWHSERHTATATQGDLDLNQLRRNNSQDSKAPIIFKTQSYRVEVD